MKIFILKIIRFYKRHLSPLLEGVFGKTCRFTPTCSEYTIDAVEKFGTARGVSLGFQRFLRCNPFN